MGRKYRNRFKCRCMNYYDQRMTGMDLMAGSWKHHMSLIQLTTPYGLHRTAYQLIPEKKEDFLNVHTDEVFYSCFKKIVYRYNRYDRVVPL